jgi:alkylation response protein AidB-like acyl-CoA dehydrogenase
MSETLTALQKKSAQIAAAVLAPNAARVDRQAQWPADGLHALADAGLMGLLIPHHLGGLGEGLVPLAVVTEELARACSSTAMCFGMHCVASKVLAAKATKYQEEQYLRPIAQGRHITTLALSEPGTGAHFFLPRSRYWVQGDHFVLDGEKRFVTSGRHADSYVVSAVPPGAELDPGSFTCLVMDAASPGVEWQEAWQGLGMRGNSSCAARLNNVAIPRTNLLGVAGDQIWYVFEIVTPYFLVAMAGVYVGIAQGALDLTIARLQGRRHEHTGETLSTISVLSDEVADMWTRTERARQLVLHAARLGDAGSPDAQAALFAAKLEVAGTAVVVTNAAMRLSGGQGYQENSTAARLLRDAQAAHGMSPTTHLLKRWLGRSLLGLPLL